MKVLYVETGTEGHHQVYLRSLIENCDIESVVYSPQKIKNINCKQYIHQIDWAKKSFYLYVKWIRELYQISEIENPDVIHFLDGDTIMRYMGIGFGKLLTSKKIITYHHFFLGNMRKISYRMMTHGGTAVVHTKKIQQKLLKCGVCSVAHIEYPAFEYYEIKSIDEQYAKKYFGIDKHIPVFGVIGATDSYKGLDILVDALKLVKSQICLFVAGKESDIRKEKIHELKRYPNIVLVDKLGWMTEKEYLMSIMACDYIILPYRNSFDGASGPLVDGVVADKIIIGANHGSLGSLIKDNNLGYTFISEDIESLSSVIDLAVCNDFPKENTKRNEYLNYLRPERFYCEYIKLYHDI